MELVEDKPAPGFGEARRGVFGSTDHAGGNGGSFSGIAEEFILAVIEFHGRLGGVASGAMHIHQQFAVVNREFRMFFIWEVVFKQPVAFGADYFNRAVGVGGAAHCIDGVHCR